MKRLFCLTLILASPTLLAQTSQWTACGNTEEDALSSLTMTIINSTEASVSQQTTSRSLLGFELFGSNASVERSSRSSLRLSDVKFSEQNGETCATITRDSLRKLTRSYLQLAQNYQLRNLPDNRQQRQDTASHWLANLRQIDNLLLVFPELANRQQQQRLTRQQTRLAGALAELHNQAVTFSLPTDAARLFLAGQRQPLGEEIPLPAGEYTYLIQSNGRCDVEGSLTLAENENKRIEIDLTEYQYPTLMITSNHPAQTSLTVDGQSQTLGQQLTMERCDGNVQVELTYRDGSHSDQASERYTLEPGKQIEDSFTFRSQQELQQLSTLANSFNSGSRLELKYAYGGLPDEFKDYQGGGDYHGMHQTYLAWMQTRSWFRHGPGLMFAKGVDGHHSGDLYYQVGLQLGDIGDGVPMHIGRYIAIVPFVDVQLGIGNHQYVSENSDQVINRYQQRDTQEDDDFVRDHLVARIGGGVDLAFTSAVSLQVFAHQALTQEENFTAGAGLTFKIN